MSDNKEKTIELIDENGNKEEFKELTTLEIEDSRYIILIPHNTLEGNEVNEDDDNEEEIEVVILRMEYDGNDNLVLVNIEDNEELNEVIAAYEAIEDEII